MQSSRSLKIASCARTSRSSASVTHLRLQVKVVEGEKERIQSFEGIVIKINRGGNRAAFTVRKVSYGIGVERIFPLHSPRIEKIQVLSHGRVRRARLYYLRELSGKAARVASA